MKYTVSIATVFESSLERTFKTPFLCDVTKVHTGYGLMPKIVGTEEDTDWGKPGSSKRVIAAKSLTFKGGEASTDHVLDRIENKFWRIQVDSFKSWMLGFHKFVGEWETTALSPHRTQVIYTYHLHAHLPVLAPFQWLFVNLFWKKYMQHVIENIRVLIDQNEPYQYH